MEDSTLSTAKAGKTRKKVGSTSYPEPFVVAAHREHKQSLFLLHGRGSNGERFGLEFLRSQTSMPELEFPGASRSPATLQDRFPDMKFIFPTARKRRAEWYNRASINQWFDSVPIDEQDCGMSKKQEEWQLEGLRESRAFLQSTVDEEVRVVGAMNVFIGGLSQGCAMGLHLLLSYEGSCGKHGNDRETGALGGFVGMSGWLPFAEDIDGILHLRNSSDNEQDGNENNPFATTSDKEADGGNRGGNGSDDEDDSPSPAAQVCNFVRDNMDLPPITTPQPLCLRTAVFLGHGKRDEKVNVAKGLRAAESLRDLGVHVTWREYDEGHWYKVPEEIDAVVEFLRGRLTLTEECCKGRPQDQFDWQAEEDLLLKGFHCPYTECHRNLQSRSELKGSLPQGQRWCVHDGCLYATGAPQDWLKHSLLPHHDLLAP